MTPNDLSVELGIDARALRAWLRREHPRPADDRGRRYNDLPSAVIDAAREHFSCSPVRGRSLAASKPGRRARESSDEAYVIDLCDEVLAEQGLRQHRFDWLLGDAGQRRPARLPVDAYYPEHGLVVEYRERQHDEPVPFMDRHDTISGVKRGEQRLQYDRRREQLIPEHGLRLILIRPSDLQADSRGRLRCDDRRADLDAIRTLLTASENRS